MQNYHKHTFYSNVFTPDCAASYEDYVSRALSLGHNVISSVEHGYQGNYYVPYELVQKENKKMQILVEEGQMTDEEFNKRKLKFIFGAEAYWVKDRLSEFEKVNIKTDKKGKEKKEISYVKDGSNCHIVLLAKNEEGRRDITEALSEASISGYYKKPRVDLELLYKIKPENVLITTACIGYWQYEDIENITFELHKHFKDNFYLEVQYHNSEAQVELNRRILNISEKYGIDIILGLDSHYMLEEDYIERDNYLGGRNQHKDLAEDKWYMDYPDEDLARKRLKEQNVLNDLQIDRCISNTDKLLEFDDIILNDDIKLPTLPEHKNKTQEEKNEIFKKLVYDAWDREKVNVPIEAHKEYEDGIAYEVDAIIDTNMADYFIIDEKIVSDGIKDGGIVTKTGRGSGVSYYINSLLGFSNIDRFISPVRLYPDRFISKTRILLTRSLPDLDLNLGTVEIFADAQKRIMGDDHAYPMISYKPLQKSSAFKLYAKAKSVDFEVANEITKQIKKYEKDYKNADSQEEKDMLDLHDYVDFKYHNHLDESKKYQGIINGKSQAPCGYLIYDGSIKREIGLIRCKSETTKKDVITTVIDGAVAENYKFVKNDLLKVDVWLTINKIFDKIGIPVPTVREMTKLVDGDKETWSIYEKGCTLGVNQCESDFGIQCSKKYKPTSMQELTALVAALRPGFKTQLENFLERKPYSTGVAVLDDLLKDSFHYIMYQENIMTYLGWLGVEQTKTYDIIKKISKKKLKGEALEKLKEELLDGWIENTGTEDGFEKTWNIIEASAQYSFNASHAYSYAYDSVYGAYLKAHYPYEYYSVMMQHLSEKGKKDKVAEYKMEMLEFFGIKEGAFRLGADNRSFTIDKNSSTIHPSLLSIKGLSQNVANELYELGKKKYSNFVAFLIELDRKEKSSIQADKLKTLIKIGYFEEFGNPNYLYFCVRVFNSVYGRKKFTKTKLPFGVDIKSAKMFCHKETEKELSMIDNYGLISHIIEKNSHISTRGYELAAYDIECIGSTEVIDKEEKGVVVVMDVDTKYSPKVTVYAVANGNTFEVKISTKVFNSNKLEQGNVIKVKDQYSKPKQRRISDNEYEDIPGTKVWWLLDYEKLNVTIGEKDE